MNVSLVHAENDEQNPILNRLQQRIRDGQWCLSCCQTQMFHIQGVEKLCKKVEAEIKFLTKLASKPLCEVRPEHVSSSNLAQLKAIIHAACSLKCPTAFLQTFHFKSQDEDDRKITVDIVCDNGSTWVKVVARNQQAMSQISEGQGHFGERSIIDHAVHYRACAQQNLVYYKVPQVRFIFCNGIASDLSVKLKTIVDVECFGIQDQDSTSECTVDESLKTETALPIDSNVSKINLDVSSMLAYTSSLTNGGCCASFRDQILNDQAADERRNPVKPVLDSIFNGRRLICCETAAMDFKKIVQVIGGSAEKQRAVELLEKVTVVPDQMPSELADRLRLGGRIKKRSLIIFGVGEAIKAVTVTANSGFVRAAQSQGIPVTAFIHSSRALTEMKESSVY